MSILHRRTERGWSQEELAMHAGVSARTIQRLETGKRASLETLKCLAAVFETTVSELVEEQTMTQQTPHTPTNPLQAEAEKQAIAYVQNVKAFHMNWIAAIVILPLLYMLNQRLSPEFDWVFIVALCWGGAIALHALVIFGLFNLFSGEWEQSQFKKRMDELSQR
ncbi:MAG: helix-turn-helix domain-containing protein [Pseudomonadota bacterium]